MNNNGKITFHNYTDFVLNKEISINYMTSYNLDLKSDFTVKTYGDPVAEPTTYSTITIGKYEHQLYLLHLFLSSTDIFNKTNIILDTSIATPKDISPDNYTSRYDKTNMINDYSYRHLMCIGSFVSITNIKIDTTVRDTVSIRPKSLLLRVQKI